MRPLALAGLLLGLWMALLSAAPQRETGRRPTIAVETDLVVLSVTVVDRHGAVVPGLTAEHFRVYDNGQPQAIEFFTNEDIPATIGLVIDSSSSMRGRRKEVTAAATAFAAVSHPLDELFTMNFNEAVWPGLAPPFAFAHNVEQLRAALAQAPAQGMTALYDAVDRSLEHLQLGTRDRKVLIVVSDGGDNASLHTLNDVLMNARRTSTVIYAVMLFDPDDHDAKPGVLKALARETGGTAFAPKDAQDMMTIFTQLALEIRGGYTMGFSPPSASHDGFRTVRVMVDDTDHRQLIARTRRGYDARRATRPVE
jgi:Ca-activated chloride channel family protein